MRSLLLVLLAFAPSLTLGANVGFDIVLDFQTPITPAERRAFADAEAQWERIIVGYQENVPSPELWISVSVTPGDGPRGILGTGGPTGGKFESLSADFVYAGQGIVDLDSFDTARLDSLGILDDLVLHEMGHVIGIGTLWNFTGFQQVYQPGSGQYTGQYGVAAYREEFDPLATYIPVELDGGPGTANSHWDEDVLGDELMTGFFNSRPTYLSNTTIASLKDIGYIVAVPEPGNLVAMCSLAVIAIVSLGYRRSQNVGDSTPS